MRFSFLLVGCIFILAACDNQRLYEKNEDFDGSHWIVTDKPTFEFEISDTSMRYNLFCNIRNSSTYPYSRMFVGTTLSDSTDIVLRKELLNTDLFDRKTGQPFGSSGIGDIFDHQVPILKDYSFVHTGKYRVTFEQFMRQDTLSGILSIGLRVERTTQK